MSKSNLTKADEVYLGGVYYGKYQASVGKGRGIRAEQLFTHQFGQVDAKDLDGVAVSQNATGGSTSFTVTGALASGGVATFDVPRNVSITSTADESGDTFTITGTDLYGETMTEDITGPNATTTSGNKAFKTVTAITVTSALTSTQVTVGNHDKLGFPIRVANTGKITSFTANGLPVAGSTLVAGLAATGTSTATTADVRGTLTATTAPDGSNYYTVQIIPDGNKTKTKVFGASQA